MIHVEVDRAERMAVRDSEAGSAEALFREAHLRRRRRRSAIGAALIGLLAVAVVAALLLVGKQPTVSIGTPPPSQSEIAAGPVMPSKMVVWGQSGSSMSIQVVSARSGRVVRTLASDLGLFDGTPQPTAAPDGTVYYDDAVAGSQEGPDARPPVEQILRVPITGGSPTFVADGHDPAVSPNGRFLAYLIWTQITGGPEGIVVVNRLTGATSTWQYSTVAPDINAISWSPDSRFLAVSSETLTGSGPRATWRLSIGRLRLSSPDRSLDQLPPVQLPRCPPPTHWAGAGATRDMAWAGFLNSHEGIGTCQHVGLTSEGNWTRPVVVNLATSRVVRRLPVVPGLIGVAPSGGFHADASGHNLVFIGYGRGAGGLYRWTVGTPANGRQSGPVLVKNDVGSASWVPTTGR
jgi:hypothetical protein